MITWMQRHKKYLVITIWISVIAFVGAGFVGWGSVDFNIARANYVAKVGNTGVTPREFDSKFATLFNTQNQLADGSLSKEAALKMGLDKQALGLLIQEKLLLNYAHDLGLRISDEQVAKNIIADPVFADKNGFSKQKYESVLKNANIKASDYEASVKNSLLLKSLFDIFSAYEPNKDDVAMLSALLYSQDKINLKILNASDKEPSQEQLQAYWQAHKAQYKSPQTYEVLSYSITPNKLDDAAIKAYWDENKFLYKDESGKILDYEKAKDKASVDAALAASSKEAKLTYIKLKKGELKFSDKFEADEKNKLLSFIQDMKAGTISKPFMYDGKWLIAKIDKVNNPKQLSFDDAKKELVEDAKKELAKTELEQKAQALVKDFKGGTDLGWLDKTTNNTNLSNEVYAQLLSAVSSGDKTGFIIVDDKAYVYEITDQRLGDENKSTEALKAAFKQQISGLIANELIQRLGTKYPIEIYYKGNEL